jgi:putative PIN family toxin of toxin-antitoxin system
MRVVLDTNLIISGMLWSGTPRDVLRAAANGQVEAVTSEALVDELRDVLKREKFNKYLERLEKSPEDLVTAYLDYTKVVETVSIADATIRDVKDVKMLETAVGGEATHIATGDDDLLVLQTYKTITILNARDFLELLQTDKD